MNNFSLYNPTRLVFGKNVVDSMKRYLAADAKILMTYGGGSIKANGVYDRVKKALTGFEIIEFGGIEPNPTYQTCMKAVEIVRKEKPTMILAVGGGSVIDGSKFIVLASGLPEGADAWAMMCGKMAPPTSVPVTLAAVLTLPATGSEMNNGFVLSNTVTKEKLAMGSEFCFPRFSIVEPETTFSLPTRQVINGVGDAFIHVMEQYLTIDVNTPVQDRWSEALLSQLMDIGPKILKNPKEYALRETMSYVATMALNGFISPGCVGDFATHRIGHELTAIYGIDHAQTLTAIWGSVIRERKDVKMEKVLAYGKRVLGIETGSNDERFEEAIVKTEAFFKSMGLATSLKDVGVEADIAETVFQRFTERNFTTGENGGVTPEIVKKILLRAAAR